MKVLVTGVKGQLGHDVVNDLTLRGFDAKGVDIGDFNLTDREAVSNYTMAYRPDAIIHCAAYTAVDKAEEMRDVCRLVNVNGTENIALAAKACGAKLIYISTDYVFDGKGDAIRNVDDAKNPVNWYGQTKHEGEEAAKAVVDKLFIVRISWAFGLNGANFVKTMLRLGAERKDISVVADQIGSPTYTQDLSKLLCDMVQTDKYGTYHATNEGFCSWFDFTKEIMALSGLAAEIHPISTREYKTAAARPLNSRLSKESLTRNGFSLLPPWQDALKRYLKELQDNA